MSPVAPSRAGARRRVYLDTSVYLCILLAEDGSKRLMADTAGAELLSSVLLVLEAKRNLIRLAREGILSADQYAACTDRLTDDIQQLTLRDLTLDLCESSVLPAVATPRSLDLAHLRTALWFRAEAGLDRFLTLDTQQQQAAKELSLPV